MTSLFDSGLEICVISESSFKQIRHRVGWRHPNWQMVSADDGRTTLNTVVTVAPVSIHGYLY
jgi:hypothetical protein